MSESDATLSFEADVPAFLRDIDEMASKTESIFGRMAKKLGSVFSGVFTGGAGSSFQQSPMAMTTKELEKQHKASLEILKVERMRRDMQRAARFEQNRREYGENAELTENGEMKRARRGVAFQQTVSGIASAIGMGHQFLNSGGSNAGYVQLATSIASAIAPQFAPIINALGAVGVDSFQKQAHAREMALQRYQAGGDEGAFLTNNQLAFPPGATMDMRRKQAGYNWSDFTKLYVNAARSGALEPGMGTQESVMSSLMGNENTFGTGGQMTRYLGAAGKSGSGNLQTAQGSLMGLAIAEGMSRGRMGELIDQLTSAIDQNTDASTDIEATANRFLFISQLGQQYRGNTASAQQMDASIRGLAAGNKPFTQMTSLMAAGFGAGKSYSEALLATQTGVDVEGGVSSEAIITSNFSNYIPMYAKAGSAGKADIIQTLSLLTGMTMPKVKKIMDRLAQGPLGKIDMKAHSAAMYGSAPSYMYQPRVDRAKGEDALRPDIATKGPADALADFDTSNEIMLENSANMPMDQQREQDRLNRPGGDGDYALTSQDFMKKYLRKGGGLGMRSGKKHEGQDIFFPPGTVVHSPCDGTVVAVRSDFSTGGAAPEPNNGAMVWINSSIGGQWRFYHLDPKTLKVTQGSKIEQGDEIGKTLDFKQWKNGVKTHLHTELRNGEGVAIDPAMNADLEKLISPVTNLGPATPMVGGDMWDAGMKGLGGSGAAGGSGVTVNLQITDKTGAGVNVEQETKANAQKAKQPAPGDTPAMSGIVDPFQ